MSDQNTPQTWPDLAIGLYDRLTGRNAEITYEFDQFEMHIPAQAGGGGQTASAPWKLHGTLKIRTRNVD